MKRHHLLNGRQSEKILILSRKLKKKPKTFKQHKDNKSKFLLNNKIKETKQTRQTQESAKQQGRKESIQPTIQRRLFESDIIFG